MPNNNYREPLAADPKGFLDSIGIRNYVKDLSARQMKELVELYVGIHDFYIKNPNAPITEVIKEFPLLGSEGGLPHDLLASTVAAAQAENGIAEGNTLPDPKYREKYLQANGFSDEEIKGLISNDNRSREFFKINKGLRKEAIERNAQREVEAKNAPIAAEKIRMENIAKLSKPINIGDIPDVTNVHSAEHGPIWQQQYGKGSLGGLWNEAQKGYLENPFEKVVGLTPGEKEARLLHRELNPNSTEARQKLADIEEGLQRHARSDRASKAAQPYLDKTTADFAAQHKGLWGDIEERDRNILYREMQEQLEKANPGIAAKYLTNGVAGHGQIAKEQSEYRTKEAKAVQDAINLRQAENRRATIAATLGNQSSNLQAAKTAGDLSKADAESNLTATNALFLAKQNDLQEKRLHNEILREHGQTDRAIQQAEANMQAKKRKEEIDFNRDRYKEIADVASKLPVSSRTTTSVGAEPVKSEPTFNKNIGAFGMGLGRHMMGFTERKKGGRVYRADGGQVDTQQAINDAVIQGTTPFRELDRQVRELVMNRKLAKGGHVDGHPVVLSDILGHPFGSGRLLAEGIKEAFDKHPNMTKEQAWSHIMSLKAPELVELPEIMKHSPKAKKFIDDMLDRYFSKNHLATGGDVQDPISKGVQKAQELAARNQALQERVMASREQAFAPVIEEKENPWLGALDAGFAAAGASGDDDWLSRSGQAWTTAAQNIEAKKAAKKAAAAEKRKEQAELAKQLALEHQNEREFGLSEKQHGLKEREYNEGNEKRLAELEAIKATTGLHNAQAKKFNSGYDLEGSPPHLQYTRPQTKETTKAITKAEALMKATDVASQHFDSLEQDILSAETGKASAFISDIPSLGLGNWAGSKLAGTDTATMGAFDSDADEAISSIINMEKVAGEGQGRTVASIANAAVKGKPGKYLEQSKNIEKARSNRIEILKNKQHAFHMAQTNGAPPAVLASMQESIDFEKAKIKNLEKSLSVGRSNSNQNAGQKAAAANSDNAVTEEMRRRGLLK